MQYVNNALAEWKIIFSSIYEKNKTEPKNDQVEKSF